MRTTLRAFFSVHCNRLTSLNVDRRATDELLRILSWTGRLHHHCKGMKFLFSQGMSVGPTDQGFAALFDGLGGDVLREDCAIIGDIHAVAAALFGLDALAILGVVPEVSAVSHPKGTSRTRIAVSWILPQVLGEATFLPRVE